MRILVIGGTQFVGRHIVEALLADGDYITLFHRGRTGPALFPEAEHRLGDRDSDLSALASGQWDATVDVSAYFPRQVQMLAEALGGRGGRYVHISSVSAYADARAPGLTEDAPLAVLDDPTTETMDNTTYGGLKALCELASHEYFGGSSSGALSIVRPTYVAGPYDHTGRFTWWVQRAARGGHILAPGPTDSPFTVIDARDLANFVALIAHGRVTGTFHTVSPRPPFSFADFLTTILSEVGPPGTELVWVDASVLEAANVTAAELPLWGGPELVSDTTGTDPSRALAAGLRPRPLAQTVREVYEHELAEPTAVRRPVGMSPESEQELLRSSEKA
jgi:2'-hydroxyisoflavone reductase